jgi:hypothetical protein
MIASIDAAQESDVLLMLDLLAPDNVMLPPDIAQWLLSIKFSDEQRSRMLVLADRGNQGTLTSEERDEMQRYARVGDALTFLHSKARLSLRQSARSA